MEVEDICIINLETELLWSYLWRERKLLMVLGFKLADVESESRIMNKTCIAFPIKTKEKKSPAIVDNDTIPSKFLHIYKIYMYKTALTEVHHNKGAGPTSLALSSSFSNLKTSKNIQNSTNSLLIRKIIYETTNTLFKKRKEKKTKSGYSL